MVRYPPWVGCVPAGANLWSPRDVAEASWRHLSTRAPGEVATAAPAQRTFAHFLAPERGHLTHLRFRYPSAIIEPNRDQFISCPVKLDGDVGFLSRAIFVRGS